MVSKNVKRILIHGECLEHHLFKIALYFAETKGYNVWFITPKPFQDVPFKDNIPHKEVLKLITFLYLQNHLELTEKLNELHIWHTIPHVIIVNDLDNYLNCYSNNLQNNAFLIASLNEAVQTCMKKHSLDVYLLVALYNQNAILQNLINLYFDRVVKSIGVHSVNVNELI